MLHVEKACDLSRLPEERRWLIEGLWGEQAVGIVGGEPKSFKSFTALDMAVSVASATPCLTRFQVASPGRVLLFAAEDSLPMVRQRLEGIARLRRLDFASLDVCVITEPVVRLDLERDRRALLETVARWRPRLLVLDPFVRLHRIDENAVAEVAPLLAYLRELQRQHEMAVLLVHHARKGASHVRGGQALRGSSELHAWGDSNLYLRRKDDTVSLTIEHRAAPSPEPLQLELASHQDAVALRVLQAAKAPELVAPAAPTERIREALQKATTPLSRRQLRELCQIRTASLSQALSELTEHGIAQRTVDGSYELCRGPKLDECTESLTTGEPRNLHGR